MKKLSSMMPALLAAGLIVTLSAPAAAQGYSGVMAPQQGYRAPAQQQNGGAMPFGSNAAGGGGYASVTGTQDEGAAGGDSGWYESVADPETGWYSAEEGEGTETAGDEEGADQMSEASMEDPGTFGSSFGKTGENATPEEKRRAHMKKVEAERKKQQAAQFRANRERLKKTEAWMQQNVEAERARDYEAYLKAQQSVFGQQPPQQ